MKKRLLIKNKKALSIMHDAILFIVMVSLSSVVILPALQNDTVIRNSVEKHREEIADQTLLMLMTSRADNFGYTLAGQQIEDITKIKVDYSNPSSNDLIENLIKTFLGREQKHKTYSDLCVENLVCQLNVFGNRINIFTSDFDESLKDKLKDVIGKYLGDKYKFNLVTKWKPIIGIVFGGYMEIGSSPPETTHVAKCYATLPNTYFSNWFESIDDFISETIDDITSFASDENQLKEEIKNLTKDIIEKVVLYGFGDQSGILEKTIDYVFSPVEKGIDKIFGDSANMLLGPLEQVFPGVTNGLTDKLIEIISGSIGFNITDTNGDGKINCSDALDSLKSYVLTFVEGQIFGVFDSYLDVFVDFIIKTIDFTTQILEFKQNLIDFIKEHINPLRAEIIITIWEVRG